LSLKITTTEPITKPNIIKPIKSFINNQYFIAGAHASSKALKDSYFLSEREIYKFEKSTFHKIKPIGGIIIFVTNDFTIVAKAAPNINHTAISIALPFKRNFLKSLSIILKITK
jgi:hypothetical protein